MSNKLLTITVPAYQAERWLAGCLDSLLQTERRELTEILVIDDGSTDRTGKLAEAYADRFPEIITVLHKKNGGHGSAVNAGIERAGGTYFKVLDSDDAVDPGAYEKFLGQLMMLDCDLVVTPFARVTAKGIQIKPVEGAEELEREKVLPFGGVRMDHLHIRMHEWTIRTELLKQHTIRLTEHCYYVDMQYILFPVPWITTFCLLCEPVYRYRLGEEGQSVSVRNMQKNRDQHKKVLRSLAAFYQEREAAGDTEAVLSYLARGIARMEANQVQIALSLPIGKAAKQELLESERFLRDECPAAYAANSKRSIRWLRGSRYLLYPVAAAAWRIIKR